MRSPAAVNMRAPEVLERYLPGVAALFGAGCEFSSFIARIVLTRGRKYATIPKSGKKEHNSYTNSMLEWSAIFPRTADDIPAIPNANPKNIPETSPTFIGNNSCA